mmetsp:Transcript_26197/g.77502  ORF Transcript_26197/g.77502 Transcript_26197/m.77502 type:complete len:291 (+) Transcript_26197:119-991(+)
MKHRSSVPPDINTLAASFQNGRVELQHSEHDLDVFFRLRLLRGFDGQLPTVLAGRLSANDGLQRARVHTKEGQKAALHVSGLGRMVYRQVAVRISLQRTPRMRAEEHFDGRLPLHRARRTDVAAAEETIVVEMTGLTVQRREQYRLVVPKVVVKREVVREREALPAHFLDEQIAVRHLAVRSLGLPSDARVAVKTRDASASRGQVQRQPSETVGPLDLSAIKSRDRSRNRSGGAAARRGVAGAEICAFAQLQIVAPHESIPPLFNFVSVGNRRNSAVIRSHEQQVQSRPE